MASGWDKQKLIRVRSILKRSPLCYTRFCCCPGTLSTPLNRFIHTLPTIVYGFVQYAKPKWNKLQFNVHYFSFVLSDTQGFIKLRHTPKEWQFKNVKRSLSLNTITVTWQYITILLHKRISKSEALGKLLWALWTHISKYKLLFILPHANSILLGWKIRRPVTLR